MDTSTITGFAALEKGAALTPYAYEPPALGDHDVRIAVTHCGLCGSDIHAIDNYYYVVDFPFVPGHEIVGYITEIGQAVSGLKVGDRVGVGWQGRSCGECEWCRSGEVNLCVDVVKNGSWTPYGGFSTSVTASEHFTYLLPPDLSSENATVLLCAGITVFTPLYSYHDQLPRRVGIIGIGGLGHLAIQYASAIGYEVTAISSSPGKKEEALKFGADHFFIASDKAAIRKHIGYFDMLLCTSNGGVEWESMSEILKRKGNLILLGFPQIDLRPIDLVVHELTISGSFVGTPQDMRAMLKFSAEHAVKPMIELMPMSAVNQAIQRVKENKARYRIVLYNDLNTS